jgi:hypothetical protein
MYNHQVERTRIHKFGEAETKLIRDQARIRFCHVHHSLSTPHPQQLVLLGSYQPPTAEASCA